MQRAHTLGQSARHLSPRWSCWARCCPRARGPRLDVKPLLAGAGILGAALGFGAQSLVRDLIAGVFILIGGPVLGRRPDRGERPAGDGRGA